MTTAHAHAHASNIQSIIMDDDAPEVPDDWAATCAIYGIDEDESRCRDPSNKKDGVWTFEVREIRLLERDTAFIRQLSGRKMNDPNDPYIGFHVIASDQSPLVRVEFEYNMDSSELESATLRCVDFPRAPWPGYDTTVPNWGYTKWLEWLHDKLCDLVRETGMSYSVIEFLEHQALDFFRSPTSTAEEIEAHQDIVVCLQPIVNACDLDSDKVIRVQKGDEMVIDTKIGNLFDWNKLTALEQQVRLLISSHWQSWLFTTCPICFDDVTFADTFQLPCEHLFCMECISTYASIIVQDIKKNIRNPFLCPLPKCRKQIKAEGHIKKIVSKDEMKIIRAWQHDLKFPHSFLLMTCPKCKAQNTIRGTADDGTTAVFCDDCGKRWCEMCLVGNPASDHDCNDSDVLRLCEQYRKASDKLKARADMKWCWLKEYSAARTVDDLAANWVRENAARCPQCRTGIERAEGCFHMQCSNCNTHFCYECGDQLVAPYYGTHHCWLDRENALT